jgi:cytochrome c-type biogenesis protein CcmH
MIWALFALMALAVVVALLWPLLRTPAAPAERAAYDMTVFRDQLAEVDRDLDRGVLTIGEADSARLEIQRRLLAASKLAPEQMRSETPAMRSLLTAGLAVVVPFAALALYMTVGAPQLPAGGRPQAQAGGDAQIAVLVEKLAAKMKAEPDNPEGWALLGRTYRQMERFADAASAYRNVMRLLPDDAGGYAGFAEASIGAAGGTVSAEARDALIKTLQRDRDEPSSKFYLGLERAQAGDAKAALAIWRELTASAPADAPWMNMVRGQMAQVAQEAGVMPMAVQPRHALDVIGASAGEAPATAPAPQTAAVDPAAPDVGAIKDRFSADNLEMIQGMVGGLQAKLAANPADYNGWMLLGRSMTVLKNTAGAKEAYTKAIALKPAEAAPKAQLAELLASDGDKAGARKLLTEALATLPADAPQRGEITSRLAALK